MTDEQAAMIAAATALQGLATPDMLTNANNTSDLHKAIYELGTSIYVDIRDWTTGREHDERQDRARSSGF